MNTPSDEEFTEFEPIENKNMMNAPSDDAFTEFEPLARAQGESPIPLTSKQEASVKGEIGINELAATDYAAATGVEFDETEGSWNPLSGKFWNAIGRQISNMGLSVGGRLNANLQTQAAQQLLDSDGLSDKDVDDLMDKMGYGALGYVKPVKNGTMAEWDENEGSRIKNHGDRIKARNEFAKQIALEFLKERSAVKQNAQTELENRDITHKANVVTRGLAQVGYSLPYFLGTPGIAAQFLEEGTANAVGNANDEYAYDDGGNFVKSSEGDSAGRAAFKGFGSAGIETATEVVGGKVGGAVLKRGGKIVGDAIGKAVGRFPIAKEVGDAVKSVVPTAVGKAAGKFTKSMGNLFNWTSRKLHLENPVEENIEEWESSVANALFGFDTRDSEATEESTSWNRFVKANKDFFSPSALLELNEAMALTMGGGAFASRLAQRGRIRDVDNFLREHEMMGEDDIANTSLEVKAQAIDAWANRLSRDQVVEKVNKARGWADKLADKIAGESGNLATEVADVKEQIEKEFDRQMGKELADINVPEQKFNIPIENGRIKFEEIPVPQADGTTVPMRGVRDTAGSGVCVVEDTRGKTSKWITIAPDGGAHESESLGSAITWATRAKNFMALNDAKDAMKEQFIGEIVAKDYAGAKDAGNENSAQIEQVRTIDEAVRLSEQYGVNISANANFNENRKGWRLPNGVVILVRDNINSPLEASRLLRHEVVGHSGTMMQPEFLEADGMIGKLRDENMSRLLAEGPIDDNTANRAKRESVANTIQQRRHHASVEDKIEHAARDFARKVGLKLKLNDADVEVVAENVEKSMRNGTFDTSAFEKDLNTPITTENKETKDEAGNVPDEEQAQPEPPAQGGQEATEKGSPAEVSERDKRIVVGTDKTVAEARELLKEDVTAKIAEISEEQGVPLRVVGVDLHGSRVRGDSREDSDLDVVVEYDGDVSEDSLFDALNAEPMTFDDIRVDINPIRADKTGALAEYMERSDAYDEEKRKKSAQAHENAPTSVSGATDAQSTAPTSEGKEAAPEVPGDVRKDFDERISAMRPDDIRELIIANATDEEVKTLADAYEKAFNSMEDKDYDAYYAKESEIVKAIKEREAKARRAAMPRKQASADEVIAQAKVPFNDAERVALEKAVDVEGLEAPDESPTDTSFLGTLSADAPIVRLNPANVDRSDAVLPNMKKDANRTTGITKPLEGEYHPTMAGIGAAWLTKDGKIVVITGRHRSELAQRKGRSMLYYLYREADGFTKEMAQIYDAVANIHDEKGNINDYLGFLDHVKPTREQAEKAGILYGKGLTAWSLYADATEAVRSATALGGSPKEGQITPAQATTIAQAAPKNANPRNAFIQSALLRTAKSTRMGADAFVGYCREMTRQLQSGKVNKNLLEGQQMDLFQDEEFLAMEALAIARNKYRQNKADGYSQVATNLRAALNRSGKLELTDEYAKDLGVTDKTDKKQLEKAYDTALERADYWNPSGTRILSDADTKVMDAAINAKADATAAKNKALKERIKAKIQAKKEGKPLPKEEKKSEAKKPEPKPEAPKSEIANADGTKSEPRITRGLRGENSDGTKFTVREGRIIQDEPIKYQLPYGVTDRQREEFRFDFEHEPYLDSDAIERAPRLVEDVFLDEKGNLVVRTHLTGWPTPNSITIYDRKGHQLRYNSLSEETKRKIEERKGANKELVKKPSTNFKPQEDANTTPEPSAAPKQTRKRTVVMKNAEDDKALDDALNDFYSPELDGKTREKQTALSGGTSRNQNPAGNEYGKKWHIFKPGTRNVDIGAGRFDKATKFLADIGVTNLPFDPVNRTRAENESAANAVRENPADTATVHNVLNVIDNDKVMDGIVNQAARAIKKDGWAIFTVYEGNRSGKASPTRDGYQRNAKASAYVPSIKKYFGDVQAYGNVITARKPKDVGPAFWAYDSSFEDGVDFMSEEFDPEVFSRRCTAAAKVVKILNKDGKGTFENLCRVLAERKPEKYEELRPYLRGVWNAVAEQLDAPEVSKDEAKRIYGIIDANNLKENTNEDDGRGVRGEVSGGEPVARGDSHDGVAGDESAAGARGEPEGLLAGGSVRTGNPDGRVDDIGSRDVPGLGEGLADRGAAKVPSWEGDTRNETSGRMGSVPDQGVPEGGKREAGRDRGGNGNRSRVEKAADKAAEETKVAPKRTDFVMTKAVEDAILEPNKTKRIKNNITALRLLKQLAERNYEATPEEQETLAKFVGWGGLSQVFDRNYEVAYSAEQRGDADGAAFYVQRSTMKQGGYDLFKEIRELLTDEELASAKNSAITAFYTPIEMVRAEHAALRAIGLNGGRFLGPSAGVGNYVSAAGAYDRAVNWQLVEKDKITGGILKALFPNQRVSIMGYEETKFPDGFFDLAIDNVPYADIPLRDKKVSPKSMMIHDFFFAKTLAKLRPGGIMMFLTDKGTLDKSSAVLRNFLTEHGGKIVGAVRLPNGFFSDNANTQAAADLVIVQRIDGMADNSAFNGIHEFSKEYKYVRGKGNVEVPIGYNKYFADHPEQVIGKLEVGSSQYGPALRITMPEGTKEQMFTDIRDAIDRALANADRDALLKSVPIPDKPASTPIYDKEGLRQGNIAYKDGLLYIKSGDNLEPLAMPTGKALNKELTKRYRNKGKIVDGVVKLRTALRAVVDAEMNNCTDEELKPLLSKLNSEYDTFKAKQGGLHDKYIMPFVLLDKADGNRILALERVNKDGTTSKTDIFTKRVISRGEKASKADTPRDALIICYSENGVIVPERVGELLGVSADEAVKKLKDGGDAFENPQNGKIEPSWEYLSGHVRTKLAAARAAVEAGDESFRKNCEALEKVLPPMVRLEDVEIKFGASWADVESMKDFLREAFGVAHHNFGLRKSELTGAWDVNLNGHFSENPWGTTSFDTEEFIERVLNHGNLESWHSDSATKTRWRDEAETEANKLAAEKLHRAYAQFLRENDKWAEQSYLRYNDVNNDNVPISMPENIMPFKSAGMSDSAMRMLFEDGDPAKPKKGREYQSHVIARGVLGGSSLCLAHCVGAGKTLEMQSIGMLGRHLGMFKKSMYVVPNHMLDQFCNEFIEAFPNANILKMTSEDVKPENRRAFFAQVANGDWDAIVVKHSTFSQKLGMSREYQTEYANRQLADLERVIDELNESGDRITLKKAEKMKAKKEQEIEKLQNSEAKDNEIVPFEELGVDQLFVDEAHNFKGLPIMTRQGRTGGLSSGDSQRAVDMEMKTEYVQSLHGGDRGVVFATGTPLSNAPAVESYVFLRYLAPKLLKEQGLWQFDDFIDTFGRITTETEFREDGKTTKEKDKISAFVNIPELMRLFKSRVDIVNADQLDIKRPTPKYEMIDIDMTPTQEAIMERISEEAPIPGGKNWRSKNMDMTWVAKYACLTPRLLGFQDGGNKILRVVNEVKKVYDETSDNKGAQLIFLDRFKVGYQMATRRILKDRDVGAIDDNSKFDLNEEIKQLLIQRGIPESEIAIVQDLDKKPGDKDQHKEELFAKVRNGEVRVLIGSRPRMGEGTNVQKRLAAIHLLHPGWKPAEDEQAIGRIIRFGNDYDIGRVFYYLTKGNSKVGSYETKNHQLIGVKSELIKQIMHGNDTIRTVEMDESEMDRDMLMGLASGNKALLELIGVRKQARKLELNTESTFTSARRMKDKSEINSREAERKRAEWENVKQGIEKWRKANEGKDFAFALPDGTTLEKTTDIAEHISKEVINGLTMDAWERYRKGSWPIGSINGVDLILAWNDLTSKFSIAVKELGVAREINNTGFVPDFTPQAFAAFKGQIARATDPGYVEQNERSLDDYENMAKKQAQDAERLQKEAEELGKQLKEINTRRERLEREVEPLIVKTTQRHGVSTYGNWVIRRSPSEAVYEAQQMDTGATLRGATVKALLPKIDEYDFANPRDAVRKTKDVPTQYLNQTGDGGLEHTFAVKAEDVDFFSQEFDRRDENAKRAEREYDEVVARYTNADGTKKDGWLKAPNGRDTNLDERQWVQVRTPSFKRWFGDWENDPANASKVVDENGEPMLVYHGTRNGGFTEFDESFHRRYEDGSHDKGFYFTKTLATAASYSDVTDVIHTDEYGDYNPKSAPHDAVDGRPNKLFDHPQNYAVFLNIRDPFVREMNGRNWDEIKMGERNPNLVDIASLSDEMQEKICKELSDETGLELEYDEDGLWENYAECMEAVEAYYREQNGEHDEYGNLVAEGEDPLFDKSTGEVVANPEWTDTTRNFANRELGNKNDGIIFRNVKDAGPYYPFAAPTVVYVVKESSQIKSATDDTGAFDEGDDDILFDSPELSTKAEAYVASEDKTPTEEVSRNVFGMTNDDIATEMRALNLQPSSVEHKSDDVLAQQVETLLSRRSYMEKLAHAVRQFKRPVKDYEIVALGEYFYMCKDELEDRQSIMDDLLLIPKDERDEETVKLLDEAREDLKVALARVHEAGLAKMGAASEQGRGLRANRMTFAMGQNDYSLAGIVNSIGKNFGSVDKIPPEMLAQAKELADEFKNLDEEQRASYTARLKAFSEKVIADLKSNGKRNKATERKIGDEEKRVMRNYLDAMAQIEVHADEAGGMLLGLGDQMYPSWGRWLKHIGEYHCFNNPNITEEEVMNEIVKDVSKFLVGVDANQVRDAITGFGHNFRQSRYDSQRLMNDLRSQARAKRQLDYMNEKNQLPPATGMVRDDPSLDLRKLNREVQERKKEVDETSGGQNRLKGALQSAKTRLRNRIEDLEEAIATGEKIERSMRTPVEDDELRKLRERRDELQRAYDEMFKTERGLTDEHRVKMLEKSLSRELERTLEDLARAKAGDFSPRAKRSRVNSATADALRQKIEDVKNSILELKSAAYEFGLTSEEIAKKHAQKFRAREAAILRAAERIEKGDLRRDVKPQPPMPKEDQKRYDEMGRQLKKAHQKLAAMRLAAEESTAPSFWRKGKEWLKFVSAAQRAVKATLDFSAVLRQAARISLGHPTMAVHGFGKAWKSMANEVSLQAVNDEIMSDESVQEAVEKYGLHLREVDAISNRDVEMFHGMESSTINFFGKKVALVDIPFLGELMLKSERHYITYLNAVSAELYSAIVNDTNRFPGGATPWQKKMLCDMINIWNGSGALSKDRRQAMQKSGLNEVFWAPGLALSRIQSAIGYDMWHPLTAKGIQAADKTFTPVSAEERKTMAKLGLREHVKSSLAMLALGALLRSVLGDDDEKDRWDNSDWFEKLLMLASPTIGSTTNDLTGGERSIYRLLHDVIKGEKRSSTGRTQKLGEKFGSPTVTQMLFRFTEGKLSPWASELLAFLNGKDYVGEEFTLKKAIIESIVPLTFTDLYDQVTETGVGKSLVTIPLTLFGAGGSTYDRKPYENAVNPFEEALKEYREIENDENLDEETRAEILANIRESNPLMRDDMRDALADNLRQIRHSERQAKKSEKVYGEADEWLVPQIERDKKELLNAIREAKRR